MTETQLKSKVVKMLIAEFPGIWYYKTSDRWQSGIPDILGCINGTMFAVELKVEKDGQNKFLLQKHVLHLIRNAGGIAGMCWSVQEVRDLLRGGDNR